MNQQDFHSEREPQTHLPEAAEGIPPSHERVRHAQDILTKINDGHTPEQVDELVSDLVIDVEEGSESGGIDAKHVEEAIAVGLLEAEYGDETARTIDSLPVEDIEESLRDLAEVDPDKMERIIGRIELANQDMGSDGSGVEYGEKAPQLPAPTTEAAALLKFTCERPAGKVYLGKLDYMVDNPGTLLSSLDHMAPPTEEEIRQTSRQTIAYLRSQTLSLSAPTPAGSIGAESFDKTQRDRSMFLSKPGGASSHESYASKLFTGAANREIQQYVVDSLDGKSILNLGGGNAAIGAELRQTFDARNIAITNVEPYPSERAMADAESDPIITANPAESDFIDKSGVKPHSADEVWAVFSVPAYLGTAQEVGTLFNTIKTVLKPGGVARIGQLGFVDGGMDDPRKTTMLDTLAQLSDESYLVEAVKTDAGDTTLILTAPK